MPRRWSKPSAKPVTTPASPSSRPAQPSPKLSTDCKDWGDGAAWIANAGPDSSVISPEPCLHSTHTWCTDTLFGSLQPFELWITSLYPHSPTPWVPDAHQDQILPPIGPNLTLTPTLTLRAQRRRPVWELPRHPPNHPQSGRGGRLRRISTPVSRRTSQGGRPAGSSSGKSGTWYTGIGSSRR